MSNTHTLLEAVDVSQLLPPVSRSAGTVTGSTYINMAGFEGGVILVDVGALGTNATLDIQVKQATDASGTGSKALTGAALVQITQAGTDGSNKVYGIEIRTPGLDTNNGFTFVQITGIVATAASIYGALLIRHRGRTLPVPTSLAQLVKV